MGLATLISKTLEQILLLKFTNSNNWWGGVLDFFPQLIISCLPYKHTRKKKKKREKRLLVDHNREHQDYKHSLTWTEVLIDMEVRIQYIIQCKIKSEINRLTKWPSLQLHEKIRIHYSTIKEKWKRKLRNNYVSFW